MNNIGYVCALATSALEGAVYIGKTAGSPAKWAAELSKAMRLSSPFIVAYEQLFEDCETSEQFVRSHLEHNGYRPLSDGDEDGQFFHAPVAQAVKALSIAPGALDEEDFSQGLDGITAGTPAQAEVDSLESRDGTDAYMAAVASYYGFDGVRRDHARAYRLFEQAASSGCPAAYRYLATMTRLGHYVKADQDKSLALLQKGSREGSIVCYFVLAETYTQIGQIAEAERYGALFANKFSHDSVDNAYITRMDVALIDLRCATLVHDRLHQRISLPDSLRIFIIKNAVRVRSVAVDFLKDCRKNGERSDELLWRKTIRLIDSLPMNPYMTA